VVNDKIQCNRCEEKLVREIGLTLSLSKMARFERYDEDSLSCSIFRRQAQQRKAPGT